jgi:hypothetical protein
MKATFLVSLLLGLTASLAMAAPDSTPLLEKKVSINVTEVALADAVKPISEKVGVPILVDPAIQDKVTATLQDLPLSRVLTTLCASKKWSWRVHYLPENPSLEQASAVSGAISDFRLGNAIVTDPATNRTIVVMSNSAPEQGRVSEIADAMGLKPVIVISVPRQRNANRVESRFGRPSQQGQNNQGPNQNQNQNMMQNQASPEIQSAAQQVMGIFQNMSPDQQRQLMREVGRQMFQNMTPEQREQMRQYRGPRRQNRDQNQ